MTYIINETGKYRRIETPFTTPDGDLIDLYYKRNKDSDEGTLTDLGIAIDWISTMTIDDELIATQRQHLIDTCLTKKIAYQNGMFVVPIKYLDDLPEAVTLLGEALADGLAEQDKVLRARYDQQTSGEEHPFPAPQKAFIEETTEEEMDREAAALAAAWPDEDDDD